MAYLLDMGDYRELQICSHPKRLLWVTSKDSKVQPAMILVSDIDWLIIRWNKTSSDEVSQYILLEEACFVDALIRFARHINSGRYVNTCLALLKISSIEPSRPMSFPNDHSFALSFVKANAIIRHTRVAQPRGSVNWSLRNLPLQLFHTEVRNIVTMANMRSNRCSEHGRCSESEQTGSAPPNPQL